MANGKSLGNLVISEYGFGPDLVGGVRDNDVQKGTIQADFYFADDAAALDLKRYGQGLGYMQTVTFSLDSGKQQILFRSGTGGALIGTFSDPPQGGYTYRNGQSNFADKTMPFYTDPPLSPGAITVMEPQFSDTPRISFLPEFINDTVPPVPGFGDTLNGKNGSVTFETALVGVISIPNDKKDGIYQVQVLQTFTWGQTYTYKAGPVDTANSYTLKTIPLTFSRTPSAAFVSAYDKKGPNGKIEWLVDFTPEPGVNALLGAGVLSLSILYGKGRKRVRSRFRP